MCVPVTVSSWRRASFTLSKVSSSLSWLLFFFQVCFSSATSYSGIRKSLGIFFVVGSDPLFGLCYPDWEGAALHRKEIKRRPALSYWWVQIRSVPSATLMTLASLLGLMVSCQDVIPCFYLRPLQSFLCPYTSLIERKTTLNLCLPAQLRSFLDW